MKRSTQPGATIIPVLQYSLILIAVLLAVYFVPSTFISKHISSDKEIVLPDSTALSAYLQKNLVGLSEVEASKLISPDFLAVNLPDDLSELPADDRSVIFVSLVLSHALKCNAEVLAQRRKLIAYLNDEKTGKAISPIRKNWYTHLAKKYSAPANRPNLLLRRVDILPVSLILAQAITESGWGTSRFALQGNALFGQHLAENSDGKYILSLFGDVKVAAFDSIYEATASYIHNINTSKAYKKLRLLRSQLREQDKELSGGTLAQGLKYYSELGDKYVSNLRFLIRNYRLERLNTIESPHTPSTKKIKFSRQKRTS